MATQHNLNVPPYNDDFDPKSNFHRVMYKPGFPIQARELNQQQNILQDQVSQFGNKFLKDGDVVTPGEFFMSNPAPYVRCSTITNGSAAEEYIGFHFRGVTSNVTARVVFATAATASDDVTFYVVYENQGGSAEYETFLEQETLECFDHPNAYTAKVGVTSISKPVTTTAVGNGSLFSVTEGSYYVNGFCVRNEEQTIALDKYSTNGSHQVGFIISEDFVTPAEDPSLLDNAQGYSNFAAPGADRLKITLTLGKLLVDSQAPDFIKLATIQNGNMLGSTDRAIKWDWLYDILAKRTYDESGNYIVSDFAIQPLEYYNTADVDGVFDPDPDTGEYPPVPQSGMSDPISFDAAEALFSIRVDPGLAYVQGYECGFSNPYYVYGNKPRSLNFIESTFTGITEGYNVAITNVYGSPSLENVTEEGTIEAFDTIRLYNTFLDGHVGDTREDSRPIRYGTAPLSTLHIITDKEIGDLEGWDGLNKNNIIYNKGNSCVITNLGIQYYRASPIGKNGASAVSVTEFTPSATGVMHPKFFMPKQYTSDDSAYRGYNSTYKLGYLKSTYFTELYLVFDGVSQGDELPWNVGNTVFGLSSQAMGIVEEGSDNDKLIISNIVGEFQSGEMVSQFVGVENKVGRVLRAGEVYELRFTKGGGLDLRSVKTIEATTLGMTVVLEQHIHFSPDTTTNELKITPAGRHKLFNFPFPSGSGLNERVRYALKTNTGAEGYAITPPYKITHSLTKTKSFFSDLNEMSADKFSADISMRDSADADIKNVANNALFSGKKGDDFVVCDNFSGDPSEDLIGNDVVVFIDDEGEQHSKIVTFATKPVGYGNAREAAYVFFTTTLENDITGKPIQSMRVRTFGNDTQTLLYKLPADTVATIQTDPRTTRINYKVYRQFLETNVAGSNTITITTTKDNERFQMNPNQFTASIISNQTFATAGDIVGRQLSVISVDLSSDNGRQAVITFSENLPEQLLIKIVAPVNVINAYAKKKTLVNSVIEVTPSTHLDDLNLVPRNRIPANRLISLGKPDVLRLNSITMTAPAGEPGAFDITDNYVFDDGQRDNYYDIGRVYLKNGRPAPTSNIFIDFDYFVHDENGDFFSVDSYTHDKGIRYGEIPEYTQGGTSPIQNTTEKRATIPLRDVVDFRPVVSSDSKIALLEDGVTAGDGINFKGEVYGGDAFVSRIPVPNSQFMCDISYYLPRYDSLFLDRTGTLILTEGNPSINPVPPVDLATGIRLYDMFMPAYTFNMKDIKVKKYNYRRYTMADIASIDRKLDNITEIVALTLLEIEALNMSVRDAITGLDRFKNGVVVDPFKDHSKGDVNSIEYKNSIDPKNTHLRPSNMVDQIELEEINQGDNQRQADRYVNNNGIITVPFTSIDYLNNPYATNSIKLHPFTAFTYHGNLKLYPEIDTFSDTSDPVVVIEDNHLYDALNKNKETNSMYSTVWGAWETDATPVSSKLTKTGGKVESVLNIGSINQSSQKLRDQMFDKSTTDTVTIKKTSFGDRKSDIQVSTRMRSIPVYFKATKLKANTKYYAFFDDVDVSAWVSSDFISGDYPDGIKRMVTPSSTDRKPFGEVLVSDDEGVLSGVFIVPSGYPPLGTEKFTSMDELKYDTSANTRFFNTGKRVLRLTTSSSNSLDLDTVGAYTDAVFTSSTVLEDKQETIVSTRLADNSTRTVNSDRKHKTTTSTGIADIEVSVRGPERLTSEEQIEMNPDAIVSNPVAQTFLVDNTSDEGVFLTELDVFFETKDNSQSVMGYIVTTDGGVPSKTVVPHSKVVKKPDTTLRVMCEVPDGNASPVLKTGFVINGTISGASGVIKSPVVFETPDDNAEQNVTNKVYNVVVENYDGDFQPGEIITSPNLVGISELPVFTIVNDEVVLTRVDMIDLGEKYDQNTTVEFSEPELPGGRTATGTVKVAPLPTGVDLTKVDGHEGQVYEINITDPGSGYVNVPLVIIRGQETGDTIGVDARALCRVRPGRKAVDMGVAVSDDASIATTFKFEAPVYLMGNTEYAFVLESPNSILYKVYTSRLGETVINDDIRVTKQANLGTLYKSQNGGIWSEDLTQDIKFKLKRASFQVNTATKLELNNAPLRKRLIGKNPIETNANDIDTQSEVYGLNPRVIKVLHDAHGLAPGDYVAIDGVQGDSGTQKLGGIPIEEINTLHKVLRSDLNTFTVMCNTSADNTIISGGMGVMCSYGRPYEAANICTGVMSFGTSQIGTTNRGVKAVGLSTVEVIDGKEKRYNQDYKYILDSARPVKLMDTFYYTEPMQVANYLNEVQYSGGVNMQGQRSVTTMVRMSTTSTRVSPVIDIQRTNYSAARNIINKPSEYSDIYGNSSYVFTFNDLIDIGVGTELTIDGVKTKVIGVDNKRIVVPSPPQSRFNKNSVFNIDALNALGVDDVAERVSENFDPETNNIGSAEAKWLSKLFVFENANDGIEVKLTSIFYNVDDIRCYYRTKSAGFDGDVIGDPWVPFNPNGVLPDEVRRVTASNQVVRPGDLEYSQDLPFYTTPALPDSIESIRPRSSDSTDPRNISADEWQSLTWSAQDLAKFDAVAIKIVMTCDNPALAPLIDDMVIVVSE